MPWPVNHQEETTFDVGDGGPLPPVAARAEFDAFFRRYHQELGRLAYTLTGNSADADDVAADGLALAWQHWWRVRAADVPIAYVRRIIINLVTDRARRSITERRGLALLGPLTRWTQVDTSHDVGMDLQAAIVALPPGRRACVVLRHVFDLSAEDVSMTLGISLGTVKSQTSKGLAQLRDALNEPVEPEPGGSTLVQCLPPTRDPKRRDAR